MRIVTSDSFSAARVVVAATGTDGTACQVRTQFSAGAAVATAASASAIRILGVRPIILLSLFLSRLRRGGDSLAHRRDRIIRFRRIGAAALRHVGTSAAALPAEHGNRLLDQIDRRDA